MSRVRVVQRVELQREQVHEQLAVAVVRVQHALPPAVSSSGRELEVCLAKVVHHRAQVDDAAFGELGVLLGPQQVDQQVGQHEVTKEVDAKLRGPRGTALVKSFAVGQYASDFEPASRSPAWSCLQCSGPRC